MLSVFSPALRACALYIKHISQGSWEEQNWEENKMHKEFTKSAYIKIVPTVVPCLRGWGLSSHLVPGAAFLSEVGPVPQWLLHTRAADNPGAAQSLVFGASAVSICCGKPGRFLESCWYLVRDGSLGALLLYHWRDIINSSREGWAGKRVCHAKRGEQSSLCHVL